MFYEITCSQLFRRAERFHFIASWILHPFHSFTSVSGAEVPVSFNETSLKPRSKAVYQILWFYMIWFVPKHGYMLLIFRGSFICLLFLLILLGQIMLITLQGKLTEGLVYLGVLSIYYRLGHASFFYKSLVMHLFEYAHLLVWGDKHNVTSMSRL